MIAARNPSSFCQRSAQRLLAYAGMIAPIFFFLLLTVAGLMRSGYNPIKQYGSELEVGPNAWLIHTDFILVGLLEIAFAHGLHRGISPGRFKHQSIAGPILVGVGGLGMVLIGIFSGGSMHGRAVKVHSYCMMAAYVLIAPRLVEDQRWRRYAWWSVVAAALAFVPWAAMYWVHDPHLVVPNVGLVQRLHYAILFGWMEILALRLRHVVTARASNHNAGLSQELNRA